MVTFKNIFVAALVTGLAYAPAQASWFTGVNGWLKDNYICSAAVATVTTVSCGVLAYALWQKQAECGQLRKENSVLKTIIEQNEVNSDKVDALLAQIHSYLTVDQPQQEKAYQVQLKQIEQELNQTQKENDTLHQQVWSLNRDLKRVNKDLAKSSQENGQRITLKLGLAKLEVQNQRLRERIAQLESEVELLQAQNTIQPETESEQIKPAQPTAPISETVPAKSESWFGRAAWYLPALV